MQKPSLTAVCHQIVKNAPNGLDARSVASFLGKPYPTLMNELGMSEGHKLGADYVLPIMKLTGSDEPLHFLAREMGGIYVSMAPSTGNAELNQAILASIKEFGEFAAEVATDIADGIITPAQLNRIQKEGQEAATAILEFMELARKTNEAQYGHLYK